MKTSDYKERNLQSLIAEYRDSRKARAGYKVLSTMITKEQSKELFVLLRHHRKKSVEWPELKKRFAIDALIEFYNLCFVASTAGVIPQWFTPSLREEMITILNNDAVVKYYTTNYPYFLSGVTLKHAENHLPIEDRSDTKTTGLFYSFLMLNSDIKNDADIDCFLNMLDYVSYGEYDISDLMNILRKKRLLQSALHGNRTDPEAKSVHGFIKYSEFLNSFKLLMDKAADYPVFQSAMWLFHGYYFDRMGKTISDIFTQGFDQVAQNIIENYPDLNKIEKKRDAIEKQQLLKVLDSNCKNILRLMNQKYRKPVASLYKNSKGIN